MRVRFALPVLSALCVFALLEAAQVPQKPKSCVLSASGLLECSSPETAEISTAVRQSAYCGYDDYECMALEGLDLVNQIRSMYGIAPLAMGTYSMLENAVQHSYVMQLQGTLTHQDLGYVSYEVGCGLFCSGENLAYNVGMMGQSSPAKRCVDQWRDSPGHLSNILDPYQTHAAIGIYNTGSETWCTQIIAQVIDYSAMASGGRCDAVYHHVSNPVPQTPAHSPAPEPAYEPEPEPEHYDEHTHEHNGWYENHDPHTEVYEPETPSDYSILDTCQRLLCRFAGWC